MREGGRERERWTRERTNELTAQQRWVRPTEGGREGGRDSHTASASVPTNPTDRLTETTATLAIRVKVVYIDQRLIHDWLVDSYGVGLGLDGRLRESVR